MKVDLICVGNSPEFLEAFSKSVFLVYPRVVKMLATVWDIAAAKFPYIHVTTTNSSCTCS